MLHELLRTYHHRSCVFEYLRLHVRSSEVSLSTSCTVAMARRIMIGRREKSPPVPEDLRNTLTFNDRPEQAKRLLFVSACGNISRTYGTSRAA